MSRDYGSDWNRQCLEARGKSADAAAEALPYLRVKKDGEYDYGIQ